MWIVFLTKGFIVTTFQQARPASTSHFHQWPPFGYDAWTCPPKLDAEKAMTLAVCRGDTIEVT